MNAGSRVLMSPLPSILLPLALMGLALAGNGCGYTIPSDAVVDDPRETAVAGAGEPQDGNGESPASTDEGHPDDPYEVDGEYEYGFEIPTNLLLLDGENLPYFSQPANTPTLLVENLVRSIRDRDILGYSQLFEPEQYRGHPDPESIPEPLARDRNMGRPTDWDDQYGDNWRFVRENWSWRDEFDSISWWFENVDRIDIVVRYEIVRPDYEVPYDWREIRLYVELLQTPLPVGDLFLATDRWARVMGDYQILLVGPSDSWEDGFYYNSWKIFEWWDEPYQSRPLEGAYPAGEPPAYDISLSALKAHFLMGAQGQLNDTGR